MMEKLNFNDIFTEEEVSDYDLFIEKMRSLKNSGYTTKELLLLIYQYYSKYVTYNYDQLQIVKLIRNNSSEPGYICCATLDNIINRLRKINVVACKGELSLEEIVEQAIESGMRPYTKEESIKMLDNAFLEVEGRPLTERNKKKLFENYGKIKHIPYQEAKKGKVFSVPEVKEHDEIVGVDSSDYHNIYNNGMLVDGICADYQVFESKICNDLGIENHNVVGIGTTGHTWSLIFLEEENRWVHFDMTMVKFYQDGWIKEHEPYSMEDWALASTEGIFEMQPTRRITTIGGNSCMVSKDNCKDFNVDEFVQKIEIARKK